MSKQRPKVGEARLKRQRLTIDALPPSVGEAIKALRADYPMTWPEIERLSALPYKEDWKARLGRAGFVDWDSLDAKVLELFPTRRLPASTLLRWYDLRYQQVRKEFLKISAQAEEVVKVLAAGGIEHLDEAALKGASNVIFSMLESQPPEKRAKYLLALAQVSQEARKNAVREDLAATEKQRVDESVKTSQLQRECLQRDMEKLSAKVGKGKSVTVADINMIRERVFGLPPVSNA
jgi:hypothetical protein